MRYFFFIGCLALTLQGWTQSPDSSETSVPGYVVGGDTILVIALDDAVVTPDGNLKQWRSSRRYGRIERKVCRIFPYAEAAGEIMAQYDRQLATISNERDRKAFVEQAEDAMKEQFEGDLREMTMSEGILLIKLIDRQTGDTSYDLIQELKGNFSAFMWQSVARLFGHNLKNRFDASGDDRIIEDVVKRIESGELKVKSREVQLSDLTD